MIGDLLFNNKQTPSRINCSFTCAFFAFSDCWKSLEIRIRLLLLVFLSITITAHHVVIQQFLPALFAGISRLGWIEVQCDYDMTGNNVQIL